ncbi:hypothetical protein V6N00_13550 [Tersicoccus sp. MR15.9]|uniref:hypothetical protein n=1 Tax=Tersicoccus mangrovi TaxID=3121635 RepID=UPI002FE612FA
MSEPHVTRGYRVTSRITYQALADHLADLVAPARRTLDHRAVAGLVAHTIDAADVAGTARPDGVLLTAIGEHRAHLEAIYEGEHDCPDPTVRIAVLHDPAHPRELYLLAFHHHDEYARALDESPHLQWWPYWDEAAEDEQRPLGTSTSEWAHRGAVWDRVLAGRDADRPDRVWEMELTGPWPDEAGLYDEAVEILARVPDRQARAQQVAHQFVHEQADADGVTPRVMEQANVLYTVALQKLQPITLPDLIGGTL